MADLSAFDRDMDLRGDGISARSITIGRQSGSIDSVNIDVPEYKLSVNGKRISAVINTSADIATLNTSNLADRQVLMLGRKTVGDGGGQIIIYRATGRASNSIVDNQGFHFFGPGSDDYLESLDKTRATSLQFGCTVGTDSSARLQAMFDAVPVGGTCTISDFQHTIYTPVTFGEGQTIIFDGEVILDDQGSAVTSMFIASKPNITCLDVKVDMDRSTNIQNGTPGTQSAFSNYGAAGPTGGENFTIRGGYVKNAIDNAYQGGKNGSLVEDLWVENCGEHAIYVNGIDANGSGLHASGVKIRNVKVDNTALETNYSGTAPFEGHGIQVKNAIDVCIEGGTFRLGNPATNNAFYILLDAVTKCSISNIQGDGCNHTGIFVQNNCTDVVIHAAQLKRESGGTSFNAVRASGASEVYVCNSTFDGFTSTQDQPNRWNAVTFLNIPSSMKILQNTSFIGCLFNYVAVSGSALDMDTAMASVVSCEFTGGVTLTAIEISSGVPATGIARIIGNSFANTGDNVIVTNGGADHIITDNDLSQSSSIQTVWIQGGTGGEVTFTGNKMPNGALRQSTGVTVIGDAKDDTATTTNLEDVGNSINTTSKWAGKKVFNTTTGKPVYATGSSASDVWNNATGATEHTPV